MSFIATKQPVTKMIAADESIIIETKAARAGEEVKSELGILMGIRETGEVPLVGTIVSIGNQVPVQSGLKEGSVVLLPTSRMNHCPDPEYLLGNIDSSKQRQYVSTHWKNIAVIYS